MVVRSGDSVHSHPSTPRWLDRSQPPGYSLATVWPVKDRSLHTPSTSIGRIDMTVYEMRTYTLHVGKPIGYFQADTG